MNCSECEQLFDAYLDGQLAGALRLEFDAHRLRCRHCQQTLAMLEAVGNVISSDQGLPELPHDFTDRVMRQASPPRPRTVLLPARRLFFVLGAAAQAAAILLFIILWNIPADRPLPPIDNGETAYQAPTEDPAFTGVRGLIVEGVEERLWDMRSAGTKLTADLIELAGYLDIPLPESMVRESSKIAAQNPLNILLDFGPAEEEEPEPVVSPDNVYSI